MCLTLFSSYLTQNQHIKPYSGKFFIPMTILQEESIRRDTSLGFIFVYLRFGSVKDFLDQTFYNHLFDYMTLVWKSKMCMVLSSTYFFQLKAFSVAQQNLTSLAMTWFGLFCMLKKKSKFQ